MALDVKCIICNQELKEQGALMFSSPIKSTDITNKFHFCVTCEKLMNNFIVKAQSKDK